jgi:hypothetical protein
MNMQGQPGLIQDNSVGAEQAHQDLVQEVLDELLLQRPRSQETVQVGSQKLRDEVTDSTR